jgi:general stress protein 26
MEHDKLLAFLRQERYAIQASVSADGAPQAAIVGIVVSERFEIFFDTLDDSRKTINLRNNPMAALVIGPAAADAAWTIQLQGLADEPAGSDLHRLLELYLERFPDGRERRRLPNITYWRVRPSWIRYSDFATDPPTIREFSAVDLVGPT